MLWFYFPFRAVQTVKHEKLFCILDFYQKGGRAQDTFSEIWETLFWRKKLPQPYAPIQASRTVWETSTEEIRGFTFRKNKQASPVERREHIWSPGMPHDRQEYQKECIGVPAAAQRVKDPEVPKLQCQSQHGSGVIPGLGTSICCSCGRKKKKIIKLKLKKNKKNIYMHSRVTVQKLAQCYNTTILSWKKF